MVLGGSGTVPVGLLFFLKRAAWNLSGSQSRISAFLDVTFLSCLRTTPWFKLISWLITFPRVVVA